MIDFDFTFLQPQTIEEAHQAYRTHSADGKRVMYFGGGTEFISRARHNEIAADIVIDVKHIPECQVYEFRSGTLSIGAGITLSILTDYVLFPLLSTVVRGIATRTARNKITVGGNLCSDLPYKEAYLPFLLADSTAVIAAEGELVERPINELTELKDGEFLVQITTDEKLVKMPFSHVKRTKQSDINYPIVTIATLEVEHQLRAAMSGLCGEPIRSKKIESLLDVQDGKLEELSEEGLKAIPEAVIDDELASKGYRSFVFKTLLEQILRERKDAL